MKHPRIIVTCGPSFEPIDQARRITNFSTGQLGVLLGNHFGQKGADVLCFKGEQATTRETLRWGQLRSFSTNESLLEGLLMVPAREEVTAVLHAAALCDFRVDRIINAAGVPVDSPKFSTREGELHLILKPTLKILPQLRDLFPAAWIVGWKYEPGGTPAEALAKGRLQLQECRTDASVVNGAGYGPGFAVCLPDRDPLRCADRDSLAVTLCDLLMRRSPFEIQAP